MILSKTAEAWEIALTREHTPSLLALSRQNLPLLRVSASENLTARGAYVISDVSNGKPRQATLLATGSEVSLAVEQPKNSCASQFPSISCQRLSGYLFWRPARF